MRGWRLAAIIPLTLAVMLAAVVMVAVLVVLVPFSIAFHTLNTGGLKR